MFLVVVGWLKIKITQKPSINVTFASSDLFVQLNYFDTFEFTPEKRKCSNNILYLTRFRTNNIIPNGCMQHTNVTAHIRPWYLIFEHSKAVWMWNMPSMLHQKRPFDFSSKNSLNWNVFLHSLQFQNNAKWFSQAPFQETCRYYWPKCLYRIIHSANWYKRQSNKSQQST